MEGPTPLDGGWITAEERFSVSSIERYLTNAIPVLRNVQSYKNNRVAHIGCELYMLADRNAVDDGTFSRKVLGQPAIPGGPLVPPVEAVGPSPWVLGAGWSIDHSNNRAIHVPGGPQEVLTQSGVVVAAATYDTSFAVSNIKAGSVAVRVGSQAGTSRSTNGTFTETIVAGAGADFDIVPSADFQGMVSAVTCYPAVAPTELAVNLYTVRNAVPADRSTEPFLTIALPTNTKTVVRLTRWIPYVDGCSAFQVSNSLSASYATAGKLFWTVMFRRYAWGPGY